MIFSFEFFFFFKGVEVGEIKNFFEKTILPSSLTPPYFLTLYIILSDHPLRPLFLF